MGTLSTLGGNMKSYQLDTSPGGLPLYGQIKQILIKEIDKGTYPVDSFIPTEKELQEMFQVSRITIRLAIDGLVKEGYVRKERAKGTRVLPPKIVENMNFISSFHHEMEERNLTCTLEYVNISKMLSDKEVSENLQVPLNTEVYQLYRVYSVEKQPLTVMIDYMPTTLDLPMDSQFYNRSLYEYFEKEKNIYITKAVDTISLGYATKELSLYLDLKEKDPLLRRTRVSYEQNNRIVEYVDTYYRPDKYMYTVTFGKDSHANY